MKKGILAVTVVLFLAVMMLSACSSQKGPAEAAIKAAEEAFNASKAEAEKYVPDQVKSVESALAAVKEKFAAGDYKGVISEATTLATQAKGLADAAKAKKEELSKSWTDLSEGLPKMVEAVQSRVDTLSAAKKLPANLTKEGLEEVKSELLAAKEEWTKAQESYKAGNFAEAVSMANSVKEKAVKAMQALGLPVPGGASS